MRLYDPATGRERKVLKLHADWVQAISFSPDGERLLTASRDRTARVIDSDKGEVLASHTSHETPLLSATFLTGDSSAWTMGRGGVIHRWDAGTGEKKGEFRDANYVSMVALGESVLTIAADRKLRLYQGDKLTATWDGPDTFPQSIALSPDGNTIAIGGDDGSVSFVAAADGSLIGHLLAQPK